MVGPSALTFAVACALVAVAYGLWVRAWVLAQDPGKARMLLGGGR